MAMLLAGPVFSLGSFFIYSTYSFFSGRAVVTTLHGRFFLRFSFRCPFALDDDVTTFPTGVDKSGEGVTLGKTHIRVFYCVALGADNQLVSLPN